MIRRTKQEALATRELLLDTAERVFQRRGVSRTSLHEIAQAAGVSRGAIYWHFADKAALFNAMMLRVTLPMEQALERGGDPAVEDPLAELRRGFALALHKTATDPQVQRVFDIATHKVEYVDELAAVRERHLAVRDECVGDVERTLAAAVARGQLADGFSPRHLAIGLHALVDGLIQNWTLLPGAFDLEAVGLESLDAFLAGLAPRTPAAAQAASLRTGSTSRRRGLAPGG
jgi:TetR/AcrR family acrAB operon transcriptional repressor